MILKYVTIFKTVKLYSIKASNANISYLFYGGKTMNKKIKTEDVDHLIDDLICLKTKKDSYNFL